MIFKAYPINRNLPLNYKDGELDFCKKEFAYLTYDVKWLTFNQAIVNHRGFLYGNSFNIIEESLVYPPHYKDTFSFKHFLKKVFLKPKIKIDDDCLLCFDDWGKHHYHWFCDTLPRIFAVKEQLKDFTLLLPDDPYIRDIGLETLQILNLRPKNYYFIKPDELIKAKKVNLITTTALSGYINDHIVDSIATRFRKQVCQSDAKRKIYISRKKAKYRKVLNEDEVTEVMKKFGFDIIDFEGMTLQEQMNLTSNCDTIVSIHGAGLTNMIYMPRGSKVLEFRRNKIYHNQCYWHLADAIGLKYYYLFGKPDDDLKVIEGDGCNLTINIAKLTDVLREMQS